MLTKPESIVLYVFLVIVLLGGLNWGIEGIYSRDAFALALNNENQFGGSALQKKNVVFLMTQNATSAIVPRVFYVLVFASSIIVAALLIKDAATSAVHKT